MTFEVSQRYREQSEAVARRIGVELGPLLASAESIDRSIGDISISMGRMLACSEAYFPEIADSTRRAADGIDALVTLTANPSAAAASELRRRGAHALAQGWLEDARSDLASAVAQNRYDYMAHFLLAQCEFAAGNPSSALEQFRLAARYGASADPALAATAALSSLTIAQQVGTDDGATLRATADAIPMCPELRLALARRSNNSDELRYAFDLDPSLVVDAIAHGIDGLDVAAHTSLNHTWLRRFKALETATTLVCQEAKAIGVRCSQPGLQAPLLSPSAEAPAQLAQAAVSVAARRSALMQLRSELAGSTGRKESAPVSLLVALTGLLLFVYCFYAKSFALFFIGPAIVLLGWKLQAGERQRRSAAHAAKVGAAIGTIDQALAESAPWALVRPR